MKRPIPFLSEALAVLILVRRALRKADQIAKRRWPKHPAGTLHAHPRFFHP